MKTSAVQGNATGRQLFSRSFLFSDALENGSANGLLAKAKRRKVAKGNVFFHKGDPGDVMFAIASGMVRICSNSDDGREVVLGILGAGDIFGEISLLDGIERAADAVAMTDCTILILSRQDFLQHIFDSPEFALGLMQSLARRLRATDGQIEDAAFLSLPGRIAKRLIVLARDYGMQTVSGIRIHIRLSQQDLANLVGVSRESVNRILVGWFARGVLSRDGQSFVIHDMRQLESLATG